jgi:hypothetical protein
MRSLACGFSQRLCRSSWRLMISMMRLFRHLGLLRVVTVPWASHCVTVRHPIPFSLSGAAVAADSSMTLELRRSPEEAPSLTQRFTSIQAKQGRARRAGTTVALVRPDPPGSSFLQRWQSEQFRTSLGADLTGR